MYSDLTSQDIELSQLQNNSHAEIFEIKDPVKLRELSDVIGLHDEMQTAYSQYSDNLAAIRDNENGAETKIFGQVCEALAKDLERESVGFEDEVFNDFEKSRKAKAKKGALTPAETGNLFYQKMMGGKSKFSPYLIDIAAYYFQYIGTSNLSAFLHAKMFDAGLNHKLFFKSDQDKQTQVYKLSGDKIIISSSISFLAMDERMKNSYDIFEGESAKLEMSIENENSSSEPSVTAKKQFKLIGFSSTGPFIQLAVFGNPEVVKDLWALLNQNLLMKKYTHSLPQSSEKESQEKARQEKIIEIKKALSENDNLNKILEGKCKLHDIPAVSEFLQFVEASPITQPLAQKANSSNKSVAELPASGEKVKTKNPIEDIQSKAHQSTAKDELEKPLSDTLLAMAFIHAEIPLLGVPGFYLLGLASLFCMAVEFVCQKIHHANMHEDAEVDLKTQIAPNTATKEAIHEVVKLESSTLKSNTAFTFKKIIESPALTPAPAAAAAA